MSKYILILFALMLSINIAGAQTWQTDISKAKELAVAEDKPIILVFQGSDWCGPCIKLDHEIWSTEAFVEYADEHYVLLQVDFPKKKKNGLSPEQIEANGKLANAYNKNGILPFVVIIDKYGKVLGETGYKKTTPEHYIDIINNFID